MFQTIHNKCLLRFSFIILTLLSACDNKEEQERKVKEQAEEASFAKSWGLTIDQFHRAKTAKDIIAIDCKIEVRDRAKYGATTDWLPNFSWRVDKDTIYIVGRDVRYKNQFNAEQYMIYHCHGSINEAHARNHEEKIFIDAINFRD